MSVTERLKILLQERNVSQTELAKLLGRDKAVITNLMQGKRQLKADEAVLIADFLRVAVSDLLGEEPGLQDSQTLIPFQGAPSPAAKRSSHVIVRDGSYYLREVSAEDANEYALEMPDDSLNLAGILPGDMVIASLDGQVKAGDVVIAQHYHAGDARTIIRAYDPPYLMPHSTNMAHKPLHESDETIRIVSAVKRVLRLLR